MKRAPRTPADEGARDDDAFLDDLLDVCLQRLSERQPVDLEALLGSRDHLRSRARDVIELAASIAVQQPVPEPRFEGYHVLRELGRGAMGQVYLARHEELGRNVAIKILPPAAAMSSRARARFRAEARALAALEHPNVVRVFAVLGDHEVLAYSMEWVDGRTLEEVIEHLRCGDGAKSVAGVLDYLRRPGGPAAEAAGSYVDFVAGIGLAVARALSEVHAKGLLHRDVKPSNVLMRDDGTPLLSDFGLVRGEDDVLHTGTGQFVGTPAYSAPEQLEGRNRDVDGRTDVYALGISLYQALSLELPYRSRSTGEILRRAAEGFRRPLRKLAPEVPRDLETIVDRAMAFEPERRYASADALANDLERFLARQPILARPPAVVYRLRKLIERHKLASSLVLALIAALSVFSVTTTIRAADMRRQRDALVGFSDAGRLMRLERRFDRLWPAVPDQVIAIQRWLDEARVVASRADVHRAELARLEAGPAPVGGDALERLETLAEHDDRLGRFEGDDGKIRAMERRLGRASTLAHDTLTGPEASARWLAARESVRSECPRYAGLDLEPQLGLLPLRRDARSGLWEFVHLLSGVPPAIDPTTDRYVLTEETGVVLVLVPGGTFWMGASHDERGPNHDPLARDNEWPVQHVELAPYFLSKYELTQGQWRGISGDNPSQFRPGIRTRGGYTFDWTHPVENVSARDADEMLFRVGLVLATEAQWERAARAGEDAPWWPGDEVKDLEGAGNLQDRTAATHPRPPWPDIPSDLTYADGHVWHAAVDSFGPNGFGLYGVLGNVSEWCLDRQGVMTKPLREGDGLRLETEVESRTYRGGSYIDPPELARTAVRRFDASAAVHPYLGLRPARPLDDRGDQ